MGERQKEEAYDKELADEFAQWERYRVHGGQDPFYPDGVNMNLIRNHIIYYKIQIEKNMKPEEYPECYYRETPSEIDDSYMARADEIREHARQTMTALEQNEDLKFIKRKAKTMDPRFIKAIYAKNAIQCEANLKTAIEEDDLLTMRRYENPNTYLDTFQICADKIRNYVPPENEQISLFSLLQEDESDMEMSM